METPTIAKRRKREHRLEIAEEVIHGQRRFKVKGLYLQGKRVRRFFQTRAEAETFVEAERIKQENLGARAVNIPGWLHEQAILAHDILRPLGVSLDQAARFYAEHQALRRSSRKVEDVVAELIENRQEIGRSAVYVKDLLFRLGRFQRDFEGKLIADVQLDALEQWLGALDVGPVSANNYRRCLSLLFSFAQRRGYADKNPAQLTDKRKEASTPPGILTPMELAALLRTAGEDLIPCIAIGAFAGLRAEEISRLDWAEVNLRRQFIEVTAAKSKTARRRLVRIEDNLADWLRPYANRTGPVAPANLRKLMDVARRRVGFGTKGSETAEEKAAGVTLSPWPSNALRHSFGSYHLAEFKDAARTALEIGHTNTAVLFQHYRELVAPEIAEEYWRIVPDQADANGILPMHPTRAA